jgi:hypothetical protein
MFTLQKKREENKSISQKTPGLSSALGLLPTITLTGIKLNVDKINCIFIVLVLPTKSVFKIVQYD